MRSVFIFGEINLDLANRMFVELNSYLRISLNSDCRDQFLFEGDGEDAFNIELIAGDLNL